MRSERMSDVQNGLCCEETSFLRSVLPRGCSQFLHPFDRPSGQTQRLATLLASRSKALPLFLPPSTPTFLSSYSSSSSSSSFLPLLRGSSGKEAGRERGLSLESTGSTSASTSLASTESNSPGAGYRSLPPLATMHLQQKQQQQQQQKQQLQQQQSRLLLGGI